MLLLSVCRVSHMCSVVSTIDSVRAEKRNILNQHCFLTRETKLEKTSSKQWVGDGKLRFDPTKSEFRGISGQTHFFHGSFNIATNVNELALFLVVSL